MAHVMFTADLEEGNIFATFGLAKQLRSCGHVVAYAGVSDAEALVRDEGFPFMPLLQSSYPGGSKYSTGSFMTTDESRGALCKLLLDEGGELDGLMRHFAPDVIIVPPYLALESLILHLRFGAKIVHLRSAHIVDPRADAIASYCREILDGVRHSDEVADFLEEIGYSTGNIAGIVDRISEFPEIVSLPQGYEPEEAKTPNTYYIGASLDTSRREKQFDWSTVDLDKQLIFCTLGSQSHRYSEKSERFFRAVIDAIAPLDHVFLVMALGKAANVKQYAAPANALLTTWAPQLEMLGKAQTMIMHGGMGTTRECIFMNVPMLVHPMMRDQFASAHTICRHGIGLQADTEHNSVVELRDQINYVLANVEIRTHLAAMKRRFENADQEHLGVQTVEDVLLFPR